MMQGTVPNGIMSGVFILVYLLYYVSICSIWTQHFCPPKTTDGEFQLGARESYHEYISLTRWR